MGGWAQPGAGSLAGLATESEGTCSVGGTGTAHGRPRARSRRERPRREWVGGPCEGERSGRATQSVGGFREPCASYWACGGPSPSQARHHGCEDGWEDEQPETPRHWPVRALQVGSPPLRSLPGSPEVRWGGSRRAPEASQGWALTHSQAHCSAAERWTEHSQQALPGLDAWAGLLLLQETDDGGWDGTGLAKGARAVGPWTQSLHPPTPALQEPLAAHVACFDAGNSLCPAHASRYPAP